MSRFDDRSFVGGEAALNDIQRRCLAVLRGGRAGDVRRRLLERRFC